MLEIGENFISVTSDTDSRYSLVISTQHGDVFLEVSDKKPDDDSVFIEPIRFRDPEQGAQLPALTAGLREIIRSFREFEGRTLAPIVDYNRLMRTVTLPPTLEVKKSRRSSESRIQIIGITDDEEDFGQDRRWLDIAVSQAGDVTLGFRGIGFDHKTSEEIMEQVSVTFRSEANGGQYPVMAHTFTQVAEAIGSRKN